MMAVYFHFLFIFTIIDLLLKLDIMLYITSVNWYLKRNRPINQLLKSLFGLLCHPFLDFCLMYFKVPVSSCQFLC